MLSGVGRTLITAGVLLLLFVAYQLWGTGIRQAQAQTKSLNAFEAQLAQLGAAPINLNEDPALGTTDTLPSATAPSAALPSATTGPTNPPTGDSVAVTTSGPTTIAGPTTTALPQVRAGRSKMQAPKAGKTMGLMVIPRIKLRQTVVEGTAKDDLQTGPGHYSGTPYPGQPGNAGIAGHRTTYGAPFFNLNLLKPGDPIFIQTLQGNFRYDVIDACQPKCTGSGWFVVTPTDRHVLANTPDQNLLTLTTCHPQYTARERLVVRARLVGPAAAADFFAPVAPPTTASPAATAPPPTTASPTSEASATDDGIAFDTASATEISGDTDPSTVDTAPTSAVPTTVPAADVAAEVPSLSGERDPHGSGPVWKVGLFQGHRSTWLETGVLALLCAAIWLGFWLLARPRRLLAQFLIYSAGFVFVFIPALYFCFEHLARLLPENL